MRRIKPAAILFLLAPLAFFSTARAGGLEPPGAPAPTMKTLVDVEPRQAIRNPVNSLVPIVIDQPGSYYLAEDIFAFPNAHGIEIKASHVTLDMNGFSLIGNIEVGSSEGIIASPPFGFLEDLVIRNGTVRNFFGHGIYLPFAKYCLIEDMRVLHNGLGGNGHGILADTSVIKDSIVVDHPGNGITGSELVITGCISSDNATGIAGNVVTESISFNNTGNGIVVGSNGVVAHTSTVANGGFGVSATNSLVVENAADGVSAVGSTSVNNEVN